MDLKKGDQIIITNSEDNYTHSTDGSIGTIVSISKKDHVCKVKFTHFTGKYHRTPITFDCINLDHVQKLTKLHKALL